MLLEYLCKLRDLINVHDRKIKSECIIKSNNNLINFLKNSTFKKKHPQYIKTCHKLDSRTICLVGGNGGQDNFEKIMNEITSDLDEILKSAQNNGIENETIYNNLNEIIDVATLLIKNLGEQYELSQTENKESKEIQEQIVDIIKSLKDYLDPK